MTESVPRVQRGWSIYRPMLRREIKLGRFAQRLSAGKIWIFQRLVEIKFQRSLALGNARYPVEILTIVSIQYQQGLPASSPTAAFRAFYPAKRSIVVPERRNATLSWWHERYAATECLTFCTHAWMSRICSGDSQFEVEEDLSEIKGFYNLQKGGGTIFFSVNVERTTSDCDETSLYNYSPAYSEQTVFLIMKK